MGASVTTATADLDGDLLDATGILFCEGYIWDSQTAREAFLQAATRVKSGGGRIGFSLSDTFCVERHRQAFLSLFDRDIDILLANFAEVDTHVFRLGNRTGLAPGKTVLDVEKKLEKRVPEPYRLHAHHWLILHGRYVCVARTPKCGACSVRDLCRFKAKTV